MDNKLTRIFRRETMVTEKQIAKMPKVELHCHLDGSVSPATIKKMAELQGVAFPKTQEEIDHLLTAPEHTRDLNEYLEKFDYVVNLLQTEEALTMAAYDVIRQAHEDHVYYIEVRFAPSLHTQKGLTHIQIVDAVLAGLKQAEEDFGVKSNALLCGMRHEELADIEKIAELTRDYLGRGVASFDLAGDEIHFPPFDFEHILNNVEAWNVPLTLHAGECGCGKNVADAIYLGAKRIGHGIALKDTPEYFELVTSRDVLIEMAPTSNFQTKTVGHISEYPFQVFREAGIKVSINTDNRTVSATNLNKEYAKLAKWYELKVEDFRDMNMDAAAAAFISETQKLTLQSEILSGFLEI
jgi:adenosine deaminase